MVGGEEKEVAKNKENKWDFVAVTAPEGSVTTKVVEGLTTNNIMIRIKFAGGDFLSLDKAKEAIEDNNEFSGLNLQKITIEKDNRLSVKKGVISTELWNSIKAEGGDMNVPYRVTIGKNSEEGVEEIAKLAFYRDGTVAIEDIK